MTRNQALARFARRRPEAGLSGCERIYRLGNGREPGFCRASAGQFWEWSI